MRALIPEKVKLLASEYLTKDSPAGIVYELTDAICSKIDDGILVWEPETIWTTMSNAGYNLSDLAKNQVMAVRALKSRPNLLLTTSSEIKNLALAISGEIPLTDREEDVDTEHLAWFVEFCELFITERTVSIDYEAEEFVARTMFEEGFFSTPIQLSFAQDALSKLNHNGDDYKMMIKAEMSKDGENITDPIIKAQFEKIDRVNMFVSLMKNLHEESLIKLGKY